MRQSEAALVLHYQYTVTAKELSRHSTCKVYTISTRFSARQLVVLRDTILAKIARLNPLACEEGDGWDSGGIR
ncbi:hypothetical protein RRG08_053793 [Elysia crispata]|uniref:Uncharacterized protein n=1 Tax=Elysia crispata TaxID=231223 RepID=A0AAE1DDV8_9GAST|nr:hypothetical protein RRG08_053793 [Elysia crispata]